jgi:phosphohistidine phosphatase
MKTLLLLRHAKSDWDHPELDDHDRPLNSRGLRNAPRMGKFIRDAGLTPQACLTSTAVRARHTAWLAISSMKSDVPISEIPGLYDFGDGEAIERAIALHGSDASPLLVVAHNPCIQAFAMNTCDGGDDAALAAMSSKYPTCTLSEIEYDMASWSVLPRKKGFLKAFTTPKSLT